LVPPGLEAATISTFFCGAHVCAIAQRLAAKIITPIVDRVSLILPSQT
jgi:hypothetical protein